MEKEISTDFPSTLKEWRENLGLTKAELARRIGVTRSAVNHYEAAIDKPSASTAEALVKLGFPPEKIPANCKNIIRTSNCVMTDEERDFAEIRHGLVLSFLKCYSLNEHEWYDVAVFGYLHAVQLWFRRNDLYRYSFSTIAYSCMRNFVWRERKKASRRPRTVSLDDIIPGTEDFTYGDILCDPRDCVGI